MGTKAVLYIVIPCYNEEKVLSITSGIFLEKMQKLIQDEKIDEKSRIMFVNDGSKDRTWEIILELAKEKMSTLLESARVEIEDIKMRY